MKSKRKSKISGEVELQFSLVDPADPSASPEQILSKFQTIAAVTPGSDITEGDELGQLDSGDGAGDDDDVDDNEETSDEADDPSRPESVEKKRRRLRLAKLKRKKKARAYEFSGGSDVVGIVFLEIRRITDLPPERNSMLATCSQTVEYWWRG